MTTEELRGLGYASTYAIMFEVCNDCIGRFNSDMLSIVGEFENLEYIEDLVSFSASADTKFCNQLVRDFSNLGIDLAVLKPFRKANDIKITNTIQEKAIVEYVFKNYFDSIVPAGSYSHDNPNCWGFRFVEKDGGLFNVAPVYIKSVAQFCPAFSIEKGTADFLRISAILTSILFCVWASYIFEKENDTAMLTKFRLKNVLKDKKVSHRYLSHVAIYLATQKPEYLRTFFSMLADDGDFIRCIGEVLSAALLAAENAGNAEATATILDLKWNVLAKFLLPGTTELQL